MKKKILYIFIIIIISQGLGGKIALGAIDSYKLIEPIPCIDGTGNGCENGLINNVNVDTYIAYIFKIAIALAGFLAVVMIIYGGFTYMLSESITSKSGAKDTIKNAVLGLLGALSSFLILQTIDPRLVNINTTIPKIQVKDDSSVDRFANQLSSDIRELSSNDRDNVAKIQSEIDKLTEQEKIIDQKIANKEGNREDLDIEKYQIENKIKEKKSEAVKTTALSLGGTYFQLAYDTINKDNRTKDNINLTLQTYTDVIDTKLNLYKNQMDSLQNPNGSKEIDMMKQFYLEQIKYEVDFSSKVKDIANNSISSQGSLEIVRSEKESLNKFLDLYKDPSKDPYYQKYKAYPEALSRYEQLQNTRATQAKNALGIN